MLADLKILSHLLRGMPRHADHQARLEGFYSGQADDYDRFRAKLLPGRDELLTAVPLPPGATVVELGAGTGRNLEALGERAAALGAAWLVDLCPSLVAQARRRRDRLGLDRVEVVLADATLWQPPAPVDAVICAYSLTMMPNWRAVLDNATLMLKPGGTLAIVDFTVLDRPAATIAGRDAQHPLARWAWQRWFGHDGVYPDAAMLPWIDQRFDTVQIRCDRARLPYLPTAPVWFALTAKRR